MRMPLLITFVDTCDTGCQHDTMQKAYIDKTKFYQTSHVIILNEVTVEQLTALRGENGIISAIECDSTVSSAGGFPQEEPILTSHLCDDEKYSTNCKNLNLREFCDVDGSHSHSAGKSLCTTLSGLHAFFNPEVDFCGPCFVPSGRSDEQNE